MPDLAILIVSHNTRADLEACLRSLHDAPPSTAFEIVVIDNASRDGSVEMLRTMWPSVRTIALDRNVGFGAANNIGFRATSSRLVLLLNSDTIVPAGAIDGLVSALNERADAAIVGPRLRDRGGRIELSFGHGTGPAGELRQKLVQRFAAGDAMERMTARPRAVAWISAACLLVTREAAEAAGLFDERYFLYWEDVDFCAAVRAIGGRIYFIPDCEVIHARGRSGLHNPASISAAYRRSHIAFYRKHHPVWVPLLLAFLALRRALPSR